MGRKLVALLLFAVLMTTGMASFAEPKNKAEAKVELDRLKKVVAYSKATIIPLLNCYIKHQKYLQNMYGDHPERGHEHVTALEYCTTRYPDTFDGEEELMKIKNGILVLMKEAVKEGSQICDAYKEFNKVQEKILAKKGKKDDALSAQLATHKKLIETYKQSMSTTTGKFVEARQDYIKWQKNLMVNYKKVQDMAHKR